MSLQRFGLMLDMSRNSVMAPEEVKHFADVAKKLGYNMLQLYTEDTYEIPEEPYFGYLRGRYTQAEMKDMVAYCDSIGVELIPCIQTLAHLPAIFRWDAYRNIRDTADILFVGEDGTYELIENMFRSLRACFTSKHIHIGMDEAFNLGMGAYLKKHGLTNRFDIIHSHLERVIALAKKYDFTPIMWSDMFFRLANNGEYVVKDLSAITNEVLNACPDGVELVYWDYYSNDRSQYERMLDAHAKFRGETWFAGGAWSWQGFVPGNRWTLESMLPAMQACREKGVENIFLTMWGDNGGECSYWSLLPSLYAVRRFYDGVTDMEQIKREFAELTGESFDDMMLLDLPIDMGKIQFDSGAPHKSVLYNDAFLGIFDKALIPGVKEQYADMAERLAPLAERNSPFAYLYRQMTDLCRLLSVKYDLGLRTREAYQAGDKDALRALVPVYAEALACAESFVESFRAAWYKENKPHGFDVQEHRLGGLLLRLRSQGKRLADYVEGRVDRIPELEETILPFNSGNYKKAGFGFPVYNSWLGGTTVNHM